MGIGVLSGFMLSESDTSIWSMDDIRASVLHPPQSRQAGGGTRLVSYPAVTSAVIISRSFCGTPACERVSSSFSSRPRALLSNR